MRIEREKNGFFDLYDTYADNSSYIVFERKSRGIVFGFGYRDISNNTSYSKEQREEANRNNNFMNLFFSENRFIKEIYDKFLTKKPMLFKDKKITDKIESDPAIILFCGRIIPCFIECTESIARKTDHKYFNDIFSMNVEIMDENFFKKGIPYLGELGLGISTPKECKKNLDYFRYLQSKQMEKRRDVTEIHIKYDAPIIILGINSMTFNPSLKMINFYKYADPYSVFVELGNFIGGDAGGRMPNMIEVDNDTKIHKAGFDLKQSFRKRKQK